MSSPPTQATQEFVPAATPAATTPATTAAEPSAAEPAPVNEIIVGGVRFSREGKVKQPASDDGSRDLLLYLPGIDGLLLEVEKQMDPVSESFDGWCLTLMGRDRLSVPDLVAAVISFMEQAGVTKRRKCVIAGTSFGGVLAIAVALERPELIRGLALINPATCFSVWPVLDNALALMPSDSPQHRSARSVWPVLGNALALVPNDAAFRALATAALVATLPDSAKRDATVERVLSRPAGERPAAVADFVGEYATMLIVAYKEISAATLRYRLNAWLRAGSDMVNSRLEELKMPVLVLAGEEDRFLPSVEEAARLKRALINAPVDTVALPRIGHAALLERALVNTCVDTVALLEEAPRLKRALVNAPVDTVAQPRISHAALLEPSEVDLASLIRSSVIYTAPTQEPAAEKPYDPVLDFKLDRNNPLFKSQVESARRLEQIFSPVFLSIDSNGDLRRNLAGVPDTCDGPLLFVGNHQLLALDLPILVARILEEKGVLARGLETGVLARGLAHPTLFSSAYGADLRASSAARYARAEAEATAALSNSSSSAQGSGGGLRASALRAFDVLGELALEALDVRSARRGARREAERAAAGGAEGAGASEGGPRGLGEQYAAVGAVAVNPRKVFFDVYMLIFYKLMKAKEAVLLFPGGAREALHGRGEDYQLFWPEKSEFVRLAARFNATIIPVSAVGCADALSILADSRDLYGLPFGLGRRARAATETFPSARDPRLFEGAPIPVPAPRLPERFYFLFGQPIALSPSDAATEEDEAALYARVKGAVAGGIEYLRAARRRDPSADALARLASEAATRAQAPSFALNAAPWRHLATWPQRGAREE
ncbi:Alpha/Beta hydrolase protein [Tribonema minus]|uniref:Alpha/Beta hydrolase protein n=1 Tax=Tribonema minus TaxID=303371 RepID=A0A835YY57_9STRA|nr:Alpha/Beta hydrolase protein [Tribonema minus]